MSTKSKQSHTSSGSETLKLAAKRASLEAAARMMKEKENLEREEIVTKQKRELEDQAMKHKREQLDIKTEHAKVTAELQVYVASEQGVSDGEEEGIEPSNLDELLKACSIERRRIDVGSWVGSTNEELLGNNIDDVLTQPHQSNNFVQIPKLEGNGHASVNPSANSGQQLMEKQVIAASRPVEDQTAMTTPLHYVPLCSSQPAYPQYVPFGSSAVSNEHNMLATLQQAQEQQVRLINMMQLPSLDLMYFDGDATQYYTFITTFDSVVHCKDIPAIQKLGLLRQYCRGKVKQVISTCDITADQSGYNEARKRLKDRFGNANVISNAWIEKVVEGPPIKDNDSAKLRDLADDIRNCYFTLEALSTLNEIDNQTSMQRVCAKLPAFLRTRWRREATDAYRNTNALPRFKALVNFIERAAEELTNPVYGDVHLKTQNERCDKGFKLQTKSSERHRSQIFVAEDVGEDSEESGATSSRKLEVECIYCKGNHALHNCEKFKALVQPERYAFVQRHMLCRLCLYPGHMASSCKRALKCKVAGCGARHSTLLHRSTTDLQVAQGQSTGDVCTTQPKAVVGECQVSSSYATRSGGSRLLPVVPVKVWSLDKERCVEVYAMTDPCSTESLCTTELFDLLNVKERTDKVLIMNTVDSEGSVVKTKTARLLISDLNGENILGPVVLCSKPSLNIGLQSTRVSEQFDISKWPHLSGLDVPLIDARNVSLLIGLNVPTAHQHLEARYGAEDEPFAYRSPLGWAICGPVNTHEGSHSSFYADVCTELESLTERFWKLEDISVYEHHDVAMSAEERRMINILDKSAKLINGHYQIDIPLKCTNLCLPNSRQVAEQRLCQLKKRMAKDKEFAMKYIREVDKMLERGYAERVTKGENSQKWYLPHHAVVNINKPDKLRVVFDCSARSGGISLNDMVLKGPDLMNTLLGVLTRFRLGPVAVVGDIEAMYNQVRVTPEDRRMLCFLFWPKGDTTLPPVEYRMCVHLFGGNWSPCTANYALKRVAQEVSEGASSEAAKTVVRNFYVDDCLRACDTELEASKLIVELTRLLAVAGFHIGKWSSNSNAVLLTVPEADRSADIKTVELTDNAETSQNERTLGVRWNISTDKLGFCVTDKNKPETRRGILSTVASVYDPLGLACPFVVPAKRLIQELARVGLGWDSPVPQPIAEQWQRWRLDLSKIKMLALPRNIVSGKLNDVIDLQLHHFCDASSFAYGAVSYLRSVTSNGQVHCSFVIAKSRLAPIRPVTIPRLELMAATMAARLDQVIRKELDFSVSSTFWSDSQIVLSYIKSEDKRFKVFVANRLSSICSISRPNQWFHVPSEQNPADDVSRGMSAEELVLSERWITGPTFLQSDDTLAALKSNLFKVHLDEADDESLSEANTNIYAIAAINEDDTISNVVSKFSDWYKLKVRIAWILKAKSAFLHKIKSGVGCVLRDVTCQDLKEAEMFLLKRVQRECFPAVVGIGNRDVKTGMRVKASATEKSIARLDPVFMENGLLCVGGRLRNAMLISDETHPIILPSDHHVVELIVHDCHQRNGHVGQEHVLAQLRRSYWILRARKCIKRLMSKCILCRKLRAEPCIQKMADLPRERVMGGHPAFCHVGLDYFGPFEVHVRRSTEKRYGCIFTCMSSRAVHLEVSTSLDTDAFINVLRRFIARRGVPTKLFSDNGTNFTGAERELNEAILAWNSHQTKEFLRQKNVDWTYNTPYASHMGGVWERIIRSVRKVLAGLLRPHRLTDEVLSTFLCEVEAILNSRPLTRVSDSCEDSEVLTPNHLLMLRNGATMPPGDFVKQDLYVRHRWRQVQFLANEFWRRWLREYLPQLQERQKWTSSQRNFRKGDLVLVMESNVQRCSWPLGVVVDVYHSDDGMVRSVSVKTPHGIFDRPIVKLCLLEGCD